MHFAVTIYYAIISKILEIRQTGSKLLDSDRQKPSLYLSLCVQVTVIYLVCFVNFFFKFFHSLKILTDSLHIAQISFLGGSALGL